LIAFGVGVADWRIFGRVLFLTWDLDLFLVWVFLGGTFAAEIIHGLLVEHIEASLNMNFLVELSLVVLALSQIASSCVLVRPEEILNLHAFTLYIFAKIVLKR
jgi:hypothetical protein